MDKPLSWRARLAKSNINILQVTPAYMLIEFTYHPKPGVFKWCKTLYSSPAPKQPLDEYADTLLADVLVLRKELEASPNAQ